MRRQRKQHEDREASYFVFFVSFSFLNPEIVCISSVLLCAVQLRDISGAGTRIHQEKRSEIFNTRPRANMGDSDKEKSDQEETDISGQEEDLEKKIKKEIDKVEFYLEEGDELLENCDYSEIALT